MVRTRGDWCIEATSQIRFKPDRQSVWDELYGHMEDRYEQLQGQGLTKLQMEERVLAAMGDPVEVGKQLNAVHKPWLGWLWRISKWLVVIFLLAAAAAAIWFGLEGKHYLLDDEPDAHFVETVLEEKQLVRRWDLDASDSSDGYIFRIDQAALWESEEGCTLYLNLRVFTPLPPWNLCLDTVRDFVLSDDQGDTYTWYGEAGTKICRSLGMYVDNVFVIEIPGFDPTIQGMQLHYTRAGRNIILPLDLTGGEPA